jgi:hypothetical protein
LFPDAETEPDDIDVKQEEILKSNVCGTKDIPNVSALRLINKDVNLDLIKKNLQLSFRTNFVV